VADLSRYLRYLEIALSFTLAAQLFVTGLAGVYRWFTVFIVTDLFFTILFQAVKNGTNQYAVMFFAAQPIRWFVYFCVIFDLYSLVLREHPGILAFGRKWLIRALGVATLFSVSTLFVNLQAADVGHPFLDSYHVVERLVNLCLFLFLLLLMAVLAWFPLQLKRNIVVLCSIFGAYMVMRIGMNLVRNIHGISAAAFLNPGSHLLMPLCAILWLLLLRPSGELSRLKIGHQWNHADEARILAQLDAINASLVRSAKQ
jgi:hypothetical protein